MHNGYQQDGQQVPDKPAASGVPAAAVVEAFQLQQGCQGHHWQQAAGAVDLRAAGAGDGGGEPAVGLGESFEDMQHAWGGALDNDADAAAEHVFPPLVLCFCASAAQ
eukprot:gene4452-4708_t